MTVAYRIVYSLGWVLLKFFYPFKIVRSGNVPDGGAIICANHSHLFDPLFTAFAFGRNQMIHFMAKSELFKTPILAPILRGVGAFGVDRGQNDIISVKTAMKHLKNGKKVMIFPEGTRSSEDNAIEAKLGAVRLASKMNVPIVPVFIPRQKKLFHTMRIYVGTPYMVEAKTKDEYGLYSEKLMETIARLGDAKL